VAGVSVEDLPPEIRRKLGLGAGRSRPRPSKAGTSTRARSPGWCGSCGVRFGSASAWERHAAETGCRIWRLDVGDGDM